jgi:hypothetical protein
MELKSLCENFIKAIKEEIDYIKQNEKEIKFVLRDGQFVEKYGDFFIYQFLTESPLQIDEDTPVRLRYRNSVHEGNIIGINGCEVYIGSNQYLGEKISEIKVELDNTYLLRKLQERIQEISKNPANYYVDNALKAFSFLDSSNGTDYNFLTSFDKFNLLLSEEQKNALAKVLGSEVTFIWGPPGTGKSTVISYLVSEFLLRNKSVLLTSHTNIAVDNALEIIAKILKKQQNSIYLNGGVLRIGPPYIKDLFKKFPELSLDYWLDVKSKELKKELQQLSADKKSLEILFSHLQEFIEEIKGLIRQIKDLKVQKEKRYSEITKLTSKIKEKEGNISVIQKDIEETKQKLEIAKNTSWFLRLIKGLNLEKLEKDLKVYEERKIKEEEDLASLKERHKNLTAEYETVEENCKELMQKFSELLLRIKNFFREKVPMLDANSPEETYKFLRQKESEIEAKLEEIASKIKQIEIKLERLKQELIENAIVIGTTLTKTYISKDLYKKKFDIVIVDEVSTALLPALFFACSLAASKIVIVGDFKQLGPVVRNSDNEVVEAWLKRDIFEITGIAKKIDAGLEDEKLIILREERRMPEEILSLVNDLIYGGRLKPLKDKAESEEIINSEPFPGDVVVLCDTSDFNPWCVKNKTLNSPYNLYSALLSVYLAEQAVLNKTNNVAIITSYKAQNRLIHKFVFEKGLKNVVPTTIHKFQGKESDLVILDLVESPPKKIKWLATGSDAMKLLNVGITRARSKLIIIANKDHLKKELPQSSTLAKILDKIEANYKIVSSKEIFEFLKKAQPNNYQFIEKNNLDSLVLCNEKDFYKLFTQDLLQAKDTVLIVSPFLKTNRINYFKPYFEKLRENQVKIFVITKTFKSQALKPYELKKLKQLFEDLRVKIIEKPYLHEKLAVVDNKIFWFGSLNILSHEKSSELMMRYLISEKVSNVILEMCGIKKWI